MDEQEENRRICATRAFPSSWIAAGALAACLLMMWALVGVPEVDAAMSVTLAPVQTVHVAGFLADSRILFGLLASGFLVMAAVGYALARRSFRDALKAEAKRYQWHG